MYLPEHSNIDMKIAIINLAAGKMANCFILVTTLKEAIK